MRHANRLSQEDLADLSQLHRTYIGAVERGERNPTLRSIDRLLGALGVSWEEFGRRVTASLRARR